MSKEEKDTRKQAAKAPEELTGKALDYRQAELLAHRTALKTEREILKGLETDLAEGGW